MHTHVDTHVRAGMQTRRHIRVRALTAEKIRTSWRSSLSRAWERRSPEWARVTEKERHLSRVPKATPATKGQSGISRPPEPPLPEGAGATSGGPTAARKLRCVRCGLAARAG